VPVTLVTLWDLKARQEFALSRAAQPLMSAAERAWWAALVLPGSCYHLLLLAPAFSLAVWRIMAIAAGG